MGSKALNIQTYWRDIVQPLEVANEHLTSTVWDDRFETAEAALTEAIQTIEEEGSEAFKSRTIH